MMAMPIKTTIIIFFQRGVPLGEAVDVGKLVSGEL